MKTLDATSQDDARTKVSDIKVVGNTDTFQLLCKASSESQGWMKSSKAMQVPGGAVVQVTTQQKAPDGSYAVAEALTFVPGVCVMPDVNGGRKLDRLTIRNAPGERPTMTAARLREVLADVPDDAEIHAFDAEEGRTGGVTGLVGPLADGEYELSTDKD